MARTPQFEAFERAMNAALGRRQFLRAAAATVATAAVAHAAPPGGTADVAVVGAGLAGLACADSLAASGFVPTVYEAGARVGGRQFSLPGKFPGQVAERGGELIDTAHKTMIAYAKRFGLSLEDVNKNPGEAVYHFGGVRYPESVVVDQYRAFVAVMQADLRRLSAEPSARAHNDADVELDAVDLRSYLEGRNSAGVAAGPIARAAIIAAYEAEYGLVAEQQSCLNFLLFIHADKRSKFTPFGISSDERYHVVEGNDRIAHGLAAALPKPVQFGHVLVRVRKVSGRIELTFRKGNKSAVAVHDRAVITIPFTKLREVDLDASLGIPADQRAAIATLGYGTNAKMMVGFSSRTWSAQGSNGASYSDLANHQATWETNWTRSTPSSAVLTDYSSGLRGETLRASDPQGEAAKFLADLDRVYPGAAAAAARSQGKLVVHLEHWPSNPLVKGSYTCYRPGQFTTITGLEGLAAGPLHFAGEHADSFYSWQGFMEGACLSGLRAAGEIRVALK
jgi:monoamine oxidase